MQFTQIPPIIASTGHELLFVVKQESAGNIDIRVTNKTSGKTLAAKRFTNTSLASFDIEPRVREAFLFSPSTGGSGFKSNTGRSINVQALAYESGKTTLAASSPVIHISAGDGTESKARIQTSMPLERLIPAGSCDELSLFAEQCCSVTVSGRTRDSTVAENFTSSQTGLQIFRLNTADFPGCDTITVDAEPCGRVVYTVIPARQNAVRLAWRSHAGSIEHYSFPVIRSSSILTEKQRAEGIEGSLICAAESVRETTLVSAYENSETLNALAEITAARNVWIADADRYIPIDVQTDKAVIQRYGSLCSLELVFRDKNSLPWN